MKLLNKLTLYISVSKTAIVILFIFLLPGLVKDIAFQYTNNALREQKKKVINNVNRNGIDYYFQGDSSYGSYTMLKEEYVSLDIAGPDDIADTIETARRIVEGDTLNYRVLTSVFAYKNKKYILEIGKTIEAVNQYNRPLQRVALYVLIVLIIFTLLIDLFFTRLLLRPLGLIIRTKLLNRKFPFKENYPPVKTSTTDFKYLDDSLADLMRTIRDAFEKEKEFTSNASHELMTPIGILQNKMENLMDSDLPEDQQEKIAGMMGTLSRLKKIVRSLLLIARIENDQYARTDNTVLPDITAEVIHELQDRIDARNIQVKLNLSTDTELRAVNHDLFFQLIYNLTANAVKYNKENGSIIISDRPGKDNTWLLIIEDAGCGMEQKDILHIFDRFKKSPGNDEEGYGIGLSIVKSIAQYHHWELEVESQPGKGSIFTVVFPAGAVRFSEK